MNPWTRDEPHVVVCLHGEEPARMLRELDLGCTVVAGGGRSAPPPGFAADIAMGGHGAAGDIVPWLNGVRWVHLPGVGIDNVPAEVFTDRIVTNSPGANTRSVAEFAFASMLAFEKDFPASWDTTATRPWARASLGSLWGKTLGVIGYGNIAARLADYVRPFDVEIVAAPRTPREPPPGVQFLTLDEVARRADHLVVAASANPSTNHIVNRRILEQLKSGVHLINVSRGSLIDQDALRDAIESGRVARASLDTVDPEPLPAGHWMFDEPRVLLSPHIAYSSPHVLADAAETFAKNYRRYVAGEPLLNVVRR